MNPEAIEQLIARGRDSAEARLAAGQARFKSGELNAAVAHFEKALEFRPDYSAAWQWLGKAFEQQGHTDQAQQSWERGLAVAQARGDKQVEKVLAVWLRRIAKETGAADDG